MRSQKKDQKAHVAPCRPRPCSARDDDVPVGFSRHGYRRKLYGVEWKTSSQEYSLYNDNWKRSDAQMMEMVLSKEIRGLRRCCTVL